MELNRIYNENCLDTLSRMPDSFLDCVVTSPPYYGLRSYGTEPQIWGGDKDCNHIWDEHYTPPNGGKSHPERPSAVGANRSMNDMPIRGEGYTTHFCQLCNAWRGELGLEPTFQLYISHLIDIFREVKRVLKPTGTVWVNLGDSYSGSNGNGYKQTVAGQNRSNGADNESFRDKYQRDDGDIRAKSLMNIPHRFAIAMTDELQFIQRNNIIWHKPACMPSSAKDRFTVDFENILFFTKEPKYWFEQQLEEYTKPLDRWGGENQQSHETHEWASGTGQAIFRPGRDMRPNPNGRNMRTTWTVNFEPSGEEHYASYPTRLIEIPIKAGCPEGGIVYDPFGGTATTAVTAHKLGRQWICSELQPKYAEIANKRLEPYLMQESLF